MKNILLTLSFISISLGFFSQFGVLSGVVANKTTGDKIEIDTRTGEYRSRAN